MKVYYVDNPPCLGSFCALELPVVCRYYGGLQLTWNRGEKRKSKNYSLSTNHYATGIHTVSLAVVCLPKHTRFDFFSVKFDVPSELQSTVCGCMHCNEA